MADFARDVYPIADRYCRKVFHRDESAAADALSYCWYIWKDSSNKDLPPAWYARLACLAVRRGTATCGTRTHMVGQIDTWDYTRLSGEMASFPDRRPGTLREVIGRDLMRYLRQRMTKRQRQIVASLAEGITSYAGIAERLGIAVPAVKSHLRRLRVRLRQAQR